MNTSLNKRDLPVWSYQRRGSGHRSDPDSSGNGLTSAGCGKPFLGKR